MAETSRSRSKWHLGWAGVIFLILAVMEGLEPCFFSDQSYTAWRVAKVAIWAVAGLCFLSQWFVREPPPDGTA